MCAICLEPLDEGVFTFPCGHDHKLHYQCAIHFLSSALSMPLTDSTPGPLPLESVRGMGAGYRAIGMIEDAMSRATPPTLDRMSCPLCRSSWPLEDALPSKSAMSQLRDASVVGHRESATRLGRALLRARDRLEHGGPEQRARAARGLAALRRKRHDASSFLAHRAGGDGPTTAVLGCLWHGQVSQLSAASRACGRVCRSGGLLRAPHLRLTKARAAVHHAWAPGVVSLEVHSGGTSPSIRGGGITGVDAVAFSRWMQASTGAREVVMHGMHWERVDPEGSLLKSCLANKRLRLLQLSHNCLTDPSVVRLAEALLASGPSCLETLILELNCITEAGLRAVLPLGGGPGGPGGVRTWGFRHNALADGGCRAIAEAGPGARCWDLRTNGLTARGCRALAPALEGTAVARLGCNQLGDAGLLHLAPGVGRSLEVLDLRHGGFGDAGARELARALLNAASLRELLLSGNAVGSEGARALAEGWRWLLRLCRVDLSSNVIGCQGVRGLADELPYWKQSPFRLSLIGVGCGEPGVLQLKSALASHPRHEWGWVIDLQNNEPGISRHVADINELLDATAGVEEEVELK